MFTLGGKSGTALVASATPDRSTPGALDDTRSMMFAALMLLSFMAVQVLVFAFVAIGGHEGLVSLGSALSWLWREAWGIGGVATLPLLTSVVILAVSASALALQRGRWIALPRTARVWALRGRRNAPRVALFSTLLQLILSLQSFGTDLGAALPQDGIVTPANATNLMYGSSLAGAGVLILSILAPSMVRGRRSRTHSSRPVSGKPLTGRARLIHRSGGCRRRSHWGRRMLGRRTSSGEVHRVIAPALVHAVS